MLKGNIFKLVKNLRLFFGNNELLRPSLVTSEVKAARRFFQNSLLLNSEKGEDNNKKSDDENKTDEIEDEFSDKKTETNDTDTSSKKDKKNDGDHKSQTANRKLLLGDEKKSVTMQIKQPYKLHRLECGPEESVEMNGREAASLYRDMQAIRRMENAAASMYKEKVIRGFCHLYSGQEAVAVGIKSRLRPFDRVITAYRCHGWSYIMGISAIGVLGELAGRRIGVMRGKGGSMHMYNDKFFGGNGIVGAQVPLGAGIALASKYRGDGGVCVDLYGDGAANQGQVFETYNIANLWKLPVIFICENNMYGMGTSAKRSSSSTEYYTRGDYVPGIWVDGMDVIAVQSAITFAIDYVLNHGPIVLEMHTYRYTGHSMSDPGISYRSRDEIQEVRQTRDPITKFKQSLIEHGLINEEVIKLVDDDVKKEIEEAIKTVKEAPEIDLSELTADIYAQNFEPNIRGVTGFNLQHPQINKGINQ